MAASDQIIEDFRSRTPASAESAQRASSVIPGANTSLATHFLPYELTFDRAEGSRIWDLDGNMYFDLHNRFTTLVHGHRFRPITEAVMSTMASLGTGPAASSRAHLSLAELLVSRIPSVDEIRLCNSGTEAAMLATRLARRVTGRSFILKARQGFHGWHDELLVGRTYPCSAEDTRHASKTLVADYDDAAGFERILDARGDEIAMVILEPVLGAGGILSASEDFFPRVSIAARKAGALVVADEVITFRLDERGAQTLVGLEPDLTLLGKLIGGGFPIGAVGGKRHLMESLNPDNGPIQPHFGTFNANPTSCAAGVASVSELTVERIEDMGRLALVLESIITQSADSSDVTVAISRAGSLLNVFFQDQVPAPSESWQSNEVTSMFHLACLNHGVLVYPRGTMCISTAMDDKDIEVIGERIGEALRDVALSPARSG